MKKRCRHCKHWRSDGGLGGGRRPCGLIVSSVRWSAWEREPLAYLRDVGVAEHGPFTRMRQALQMVLMTKGEFGCRGWEHRATARTQSAEQVPLRDVVARHAPDCKGCGGYFQCSHCHGLVGYRVGGDDEWPGWCDECAAKEIRMKQERGLAEQKALVEKWGHVPVGTRVFVVKDDGSEVATKTRSKAQLSSGHTAVIWLEGITGCFALERVRPCPKDSPHG